MLCYTMLCPRIYYATVLYTLGYTMLYYAAMLYYAILCHTMLYYTTLCYTVLYCSILCPSNPLKSSPTCVPNGHPEIRHPRVLQQAASQQGGQSQAPRASVGCIWVCVLLCWISTQKQTYNRKQTKTTQH